MTEGQPATLASPVYGLVYGDNNTVTIVADRDRRRWSPFLAPALPAHDLVGRDALVEDLKKRVLGAVPAAAAIALHGLPGVGKTTLALALAHDRESLERFPDGILWAGLGRDADPSTLLASWGAALGMESGTISRYTTAGDMARAVHAVIGTRRMLLVIDDVWKVSDGLLFKLGGPGCVHVFTTRLPEVALRLAGRSRVPVPELTSSDGAALLLQLAPEAISEPDAGTLAKLVGGLPLAITLIGRHIDALALGGQRQRVTLAIRQLRDAEARFMIEDDVGPLEHGGMGASVSLQAAIEVSYQWLATGQQAALRSLGAFDPKPNTFSLAAAAAVTASDEATVDQLVRAGLLESAGDERYTLHQTIMDFARSLGTDRAAAGRLVDHFTAALVEGQDDQVGIGFQLLRGFDMDAENVATALEQARGDDRRFLRLLEAAYPYMEARGMYQALAEQLELGCDAAQRVHDPVVTLRMLRWLGTVLFEQGRLRDAEQRLREAQAIRGTTSPSDDGTESVLQLGWVLALQGQVEDGSRLFGQALALAEASARPALGARAMHGLSWSLRIKGDHQEARALLGKSLELARTSGDKVLVAETLQMLGWTNAIGGHYHDADEAFAECIDLAQELDRDGILVLAVNGIGWLRGIRGRFTQAVPFFREALAIATRIGHYERGSILISLGWAERELGHFAEAEAALQDSLVLSRSEGRVEKVSQALKELGQLERMRGNLARATGYLEESLAYARQMGLADSAVGALSVLGLVATEEGDTVAARAWIEEALGLERDRGNDGMVAMLLRDLGDVDAAEGALDAARARYEEAQARATAVGNDDIAATTMFAVAKLRLREGDRAGARRAADEALTTLRAAGHARTSEVEAWAAAVAAGDDPA